jgi:hypothetical protein
MGYHSEGAVVYCKDFVPMKKKKKKKKRKKTKTKKKKML